MSGLRLALDSNLLLLLVVGRTERGLLTRHKRLRSYSEADYELLQGFIAVSNVLVTTPSALTEVSNIADFGLLEPARSRVVHSLMSLVEVLDEIYWPSRQLAQIDAFARLGLADCSLLQVLDRNTRLLTVDNALYRAALERGASADNFDHVRIARGLA